MLVQLEIRVLADLDWCRRVFVLAGCVTSRAAFKGDFDQRKDITIDDPQVRFVSQLAAQQARGLEVPINILGAAGDEARHQDAVERRHVELWTDRRLQWDLVVVRAGRGHDDRSKATEYSRDWRGH